MTRDGFFKMVKAAWMAVAVGVSAPLAAMPTSQEISQAEPLVQEVMKAEMDALRSGTKTREQVGDAAIAEDAERVNHGTHISTTQHHSEEGLVFP